MTHFAGAEVLAATHARNAQVEAERRNWRRAALILAVAVVVLATGLVLMSIQYMNVAREYFAVSPTGKLTQIHPLSDPLVTTDKVREFSVRAIQTAYNVDFVHYKEQFSRLDEFFTPEGAQSFKAELVKTGFITKMTEELLVSSAVPTAAPNIVQETPPGAGVKKWLVEVPLLLTMSNAKAKQTQTLGLSLTITRVSEAERPDGIAVERVVTVVPKS